MENELTFRTAVGGYRKDEVMEYVENLNDEMFRMKKEYEDELVKLRLKVQELESLFQQEETNSSALAGEQHEKIKNLEEENSSLKENLEKTAGDLEQIKVQCKDCLLYTSGSCCDIGNADVIVIFCVHKLKQSFHNAGFGKLTGSIMGN